MRFLAPSLPYADETDELQLTLKAVSEPKPISMGADFLGYIIYPHHRLVRRRVVGHCWEKLHYFQAQLVSGSVVKGYWITLKADIAEQLRATLASYCGHFKHANSYHLQQQLWQAFPWLTVLFEPSLTPRYEPKPCAVTRYASQIRYFKRHYPVARLYIQRGKQTDVIQQKTTVASVTKDVPPLLLAVAQVHVRQVGYMRDGLRRRRALQLYVQPGVELCPVAKKP